MVPYFSEIVHLRKKISSTEVLNSRILNSISLENSKLVQMPTVELCCRRRKKPNQRIKVPFMVLSMLCICVQFANKKFSMECLRLSSFKSFLQQEKSNWILAVQNELQQVGVSSVSQEVKCSVLLSELQQTQPFIIESLEGIFYYLCDYSVLTEIIIQLMR